MPKRKASAEEGAQEAAGQFAPPEGALHLYSNRDFWEARYKKESEEAAAGGCGGSAEKALFEWYAPWSSVRELVEDAHADELRRCAAQDRAERRVLADALVRPLWSAARLTRPPPRRL